MDMGRNNFQNNARLRNNNTRGNNGWLVLFGIIGFIILLSTCSSKDDSDASQSDSSYSSQTNTESATPVVATESYNCRVVGVSDGDTFTCLANGTKQIKVRLNQIDAPEKKQAFGTAAKNALAGYIFGKTVLLKTSGKDKYGRTIAEVYINNNNINKAMVADGYAWAYREYLRDQDYLRIEAQAKSHTVGLWSHPNPTYPSDFRHKKTSVSAVPQSIQKTQRYETPNIQERTIQSSPRNGRSCGNKRYCKEMNDCAEANFYLTQCGVSRLDGDSDGVPCESICN